MEPQDRRDWQARTLLTPGERWLYWIVSRTLLKHTFIHKLWVNMLERRHKELANLLLAPTNVTKQE